jgi:hypothetical protein
VSFFINVFCHKQDGVEYGLGRRPRFVSMV